MKRIAARRIAGRAGGLFQSGEEGFETHPVDGLELGFEGIAGDVHSGATRRSGGREPWYRRGTEMRNERQLSLVSPAELRLVAERLDVPEVRPEWIGANILVEGIERLSWLPPRTLLFFANGVTLKIDGDNGPCRLSGRAIASRYAGREDIEFAFVRAATHRRGLVGWVEKPGRIEAGESFEARLPEQWIYE